MVKVAVERLLPQLAWAQNRQLIQFAVKQIATAFWLWRKIGVWVEGMPVHLQGGIAIGNSSLDARCCLQAILQPKVEVVAEFAQQVHFAASLAFVSVDRRPACHHALNSLRCLRHVLLSFNVRFVRLVLRNREAF